MTPNAPLRPATVRSISWTHFVALVRRPDWHNLFAAQGMVMQAVMLGLISVCAVFTVKVTVWMVFRGAMTGLLESNALWELCRVGLSFALANLIGMAIARLHTHSRDAAVLAFSVAMMLWTLGNLYVLNGHGNLDSALAHVVALLVFICGLLTGGLHLNPTMHPRHWSPR
jgi:hypothetical protein